MNRTLSLLMACILLALLVLASGCSPTTSAQERSSPTLIPAKVLRPAPVPQDDRQIAILDLVVVSDEEGEVVGVDLVRARIVHSYAPNVLGLSGPWRVELLGERTMEILGRRNSFGTLDPRRAEVEAEEVEEGQPPFSYVFLPKVEWSLVVPLYIGARDLGVEAIRIYDQNDREIITIRVDREGWSQ